MTTAQTIATEKKATNSIRERENKEPEKPATKKEPTNEKQPLKETVSNNKNKKKCGSGKFVAERQKSMNASCSSDASSENSSPLGREPSSSLSCSSGRMAASRIAVVKEEAIWWWWNLFEQLSLSGALAELTWPVIPNKRHIFREVFLDFDPIANERKIALPRCPPAPYRQS
ncbi:hypothetical protein NC652_000557 [Populus alba x Populus x berolinensis]|nr:hypothetical protein NC652_000557 [Populus alba x Populus x berolinensis]